MRPDNKTVVHDLTMEYLRRNATGGADSVEEIVETYCKMYEKIENALNAYDEADPDNFGAQLG